MIAITTKSSISVNPVAKVRLRCFIGLPVLSVPLLAGPCMTRARQVSTVPGSYCVRQFVRRDVYTPLRIGVALTQPWTPSIARPLPVASVVTYTTPSASVASMYW